MIKKALALVGLLSGISFGFSNQYYIQNNGTPAAPVISTVTILNLSISSATSSEIQYNNGGKLAGIPSVVTTSSVTISTPTAIMGSIAGDSASTGFVGESTFTLGTNINAPGSTLYGDCNHITITSGDWDISALCIWVSGGATWTRTDCGISTTSGNSSTGLNAGDNYVQSTWASTTNVPSQMIEYVPVWRQSIPTGATYYVKLLSNYSGGTPTVSCKLSARRMR